MFGNRSYWNSILATEVYPIISITAANYSLLNAASPPVRERVKVYSLSRTKQYIK